MHLLMIIISRFCEVEGVGWVWVWVWPGGVLGETKTKGVMRSVVHVNDY